MREGIISEIQQAVSWPCDRMIAMPSRRLARGHRWLMTHSVQVTNPTLLGADTEEGRADAMRTALIVATIAYSTGTSLAHSHWRSQAPADCIGCSCSAAQHSHALTSVYIHHMRCVKLFYSLI